jgi:hypothetical protein
MAALKPGDIVTVTATGHGAMHTRLRESYISHRRGYPEVTSAASFAAVHYTQVDPDTVMAHCAPPWFSLGCPFLCFRDDAACTQARDYA